MAAYTYTNSPTISIVKVGSTNYYIKDSEVRANLNDLESRVSNLGSPMHFKGTSLQKLTDGGTQNPTKTSGNLSSSEISSGSPVTAGDVYLQKSGEGNGEYVWIGTAWELLGDESSYVVKGTTVTTTASYQPAGTIDQPTFSGSGDTVTVEGSFELPELSSLIPTFVGTTATITVTSSYQPAGSISLTGKSTTTVIKTLSTASISVSEETETLNLPAVIATGSASSTTTVITDLTGATFSGTTATITSTGSYQPAGTINGAGVSYSTTTLSGLTITVTSGGTFTPRGAVSQPTFTGTTATITSTGTVN